MNCPCGSSLSYEQCCGVYHMGDLPETTEQLMRSRYSAFVKRDINYLLLTQHQDLCGPNDRREILQTFQDCQWLELRVLNSRGGINDKEGTVEFIATYTSAGQIFEHHEKSLFKKEKKAWKYHSAI